MLLAPICYLALHLALYRLMVARTGSRLRSERGIFLFHLISFCFSCATVAAGGAYLQDPHWLEYTLYIFGLHGVYSLTFLEIWSLTQGSYSLSLIGLINDLKDEATPARLQATASIGAGKSSGRTQDLAVIGLLQHQPDRSHPKLTALGKLLAMAALVLLFLTNGKTLNR